LVRCLGAGDVGKSTFIRQVRLLHGKPFEKAELDKFSAILPLNTLNSMKALIRGFSQSGKKISSKLKVRPCALMLWTRNESLQCPSCPPSRALCPASLPLSRFYFTCHCSLCFSPSALAGLSWRVCRTTLIAFVCVLFPPRARLRLFCSRSLSYLCDHLLYVFIFIPGSFLISRMLHLQEGRVVSSVSIPHAFFGH